MKGVYIPAPLEILLSSEPRSALYTKNFHMKILLRKGRKDSKEELHRKITY